MTLTVRLSYVVVTEDGVSTDAFYRIHSDDGYVDALRNEWLTATPGQRQAEAVKRHAAWLAAQQPVVVSGEAALQAAEIDASQQLLTAQAALISAQQATLDAGFIPTVSITVQQPVPPDEPVPDPVTAQPVAEATSGPA